MRRTLIFLHAPPNSSFIVTMASPSDAMSTEATTVSAPGKVLLAGGYLVLESPHVGLVMAADKRFYTTVKAIAAAPSDTTANKSMTIVVRSPQFHSQWTYVATVATGSFQLSPKEQVSPNPFVEKTLRVTLAYLWTAGLLFSSLPTSNQLDIVIRADNDFYSVLPHLEDRNLSPTFENVASLPHFLPCPLDSEHKPIICKTGLGSSAALVTSLVASLLHAAAGVSSQEEAHNLAQICHCHAQGKVGSGFDVSSAVYGSHVYRRFPKSTLSDFLVALDESGDILCHETATTLQTLVKTKWEGGVVASLQVPRGLQLLLADVCGGSESPSMAKKVLQWKQQPNREPYWENLATINNEIVALWSELQDLDVNQLSSRTYKDWEEDSILQRIRVAFLQARKNLKAMGEAAQVPIEPDEQTALADATMELPGVVAAVVPGAGGYDALACLHVDSDQVRDSIAKLWANWKGDGKACTLAVQAGSYGDGLRHETDFEST